MSIEDTIAAAVQSHVSPLLIELRRLAAEIEAMRRALPPQLVTMSEAAERLGVSLATVRRRVKDGTLPVKRVGRSPRVDLSSLHPAPADDVAARVVDIRTTLARREASGGST